MNPPVTEYVLWDGKIEPVNERLWHHCPVCGQSLTTPHSLLRQGKMMVHTACKEGAK